MEGRVRHIDEDAAGLGREVPPVDVLGCGVVLCVCVGGGGGGNKMVADAELLIHSKDIQRRCTF